MGSYKSDKDVAMYKLYNHHQSVGISFYIEYVSLVADTVHTVKILFDVSKTLPFGAPGSSEPMV
jgi:hypothetical protein